MPVDKDAAGSRIQIDCEFQKREVEYGARAAGALQGQSCSNGQESDPTQSMDLSGNATTVSQLMLQELPNLATKEQSHLC